jgi:hypothetical protein
LNITHVQSIFAPILAPVAPAVLFGNNLYHGMLADGLNTGLATAAAVAGTVGVELSGALACSMAVLAYHKRDYKIMSISIFAAAIYAVFMMVGILQAKNTATFAGAVVISLVAYLMLGVFQSYTEKLKSAQVETDLQVRAMDAERKLTNAQTRRAKVTETYGNLPAESGNFPVSYRNLADESGKFLETYRNFPNSGSESYGTDWRHVPQEEREKIASMTTRQICERYRVSERTALNWKKHHES